MNECLNSGMNKTEWCRANGISDKQFFYWQRILRKEAFAASTSKELSVITDPADETRPQKISFAEISLPIKQEPVRNGFQPDIIIRKGSHSGVRPHKEKINISKEIINKTRGAVAPYAAQIFTHFSVVRGNTVGSDPIKNKAGLRKAVGIESIRRLYQVSGFFPATEDAVHRFAEIYIDSAKDLDVMGVFNNHAEDYFIKEYASQAIFFMGSDPTVVNLRSS